MRVAVILGTRPEIIKMSPLIHLMRERGADFFVLHTGQHYSHEMDRVFFEQLELPAPTRNLDVGSASHGAQTGRMLEGIERALVEERATDVLVQGDTNTVLAGALAGRKLGLRVGHVEAGLRSFDRSMPEETNRIVADHVSDLLFAPTQQAAKLLRAEGISDARIRVSGNTIADAVRRNRALASRAPSRVREAGHASGKYVMMTAHRQENVDNPARFQRILRGADAVGRELGLPVLYPIHPRARKMAEQHKLELGEVALLPPLDFLEFLDAQQNARMILTDSGGVQEEACMLGVPCVTLRDNTERPETIEVGANLLAGADEARIVEAARTMLARPRSWAQPFGDGYASERILAALKR